jgi:hypothetical protein
VYAVGGSCTRNQEQLKHGPVLIRSDPEAQSEIELAGVVPNNITSVEVKFANGGATTVKAIDNGWALKTASPPVRLTYRPSSYTISIGRS